MSIYEIQKEIIEEFAFLKNNEEKYTYLIEIGKELPVMGSFYKKDIFLVKGCQSKLWLVGKKDRENIYISYMADSDSSLVKGIAALVIRVVSKQKIENIKNIDLFFIKEIGLEKMLTMNRANGLGAFVEKIKHIAQETETIQNIK